MKYTRDELRRALCLYAVTDRRWLRPGQSLSEVCRTVLDGGAGFLQLREKNMDAKSVVREAEALEAICAARRVPFVVNDSVEIALASGADGVHVGQSDVKGRDIRALIGPDRILGMSARTVAEAVAAERAGADYLGVGAVFSTGTKADARCIDPAVFRAICASVSIPVVAIGGVTASNLPRLTGSGAAGVAVVSALFAAPDPGAAAAELRALSKEVLGGG